MKEDIVQPQLDPDQPLVDPAASHVIEDTRIVLPDGVVPLDDFSLSEPNSEEKNIDSSGAIFDERIHLGKDRITKTGLFRKKHGASSQPIASPTQTQEIGNDSPSENNAVFDHKAQKILAKQIAEASTNAFATCGCMICGTDFAPDSDERKMLVDAFTNYYLSKGITDIPPGVLLSITLASFTAQKCIHKPTIRERLMLTYDAVSLKIKEYFR